MNRTSPGPTCLPRRSASGTASLPVHDQRFHDRKVFLRDERSGENRELATLFPGLHRRIDACRGVGGMLAAARRKTEFSPWWISAA
jgi:hypothetical protein